MKKTGLNYLLIAVFAISAAFTSCDNYDDGNGDGNGNESGKWIQKKNYPGAASSYAVAFAANGKIYVGNQNDFFEYDPATDKWTEKRFFPMAAQCHFAVNDLLYIINNSGTMSQYNPSTDTWTEKAAFPISNACRDLLVPYFSN